MAIEFTSKGRLTDWWVCFKHDSKRSVKNLFRTLRGGKPPQKFHFKHRYSESYAKKIVRNKKLALTAGEPSWFYTAFERDDADPLTNYTLQYIEENLAKDSKILVSGCGTGITAFHLADCGFREVVGSDLLPECIDVANQLRQDLKYDTTRFVVDDGFKPTITEKFDLVTALHWVFSAWMGNYGNNPLANPFDADVRSKALRDFFSVYSNLLTEKGMLIIELTDAVADYRLATDHFMGDYSLKIYPIRHTPEQVKQCAEANGLDVVDKKLCVSYGHHPRTSYFLRKN